MSETLADSLRSDGVSFTPPTGGLFVWARLHGVDTTALLELALDHHVMFVPGSAFAVDGCWREYARLSFATLPEPALRAAAGDLMQLAASRRG